MMVSIVCIVISLSAYILDFYTDRKYDILLLIGFLFMWISAISILMP